MFATSFTRAPICRPLPFQAQLYRQGCNPTPTRPLLASRRTSRAFASSPSARISSRFDPSSGQLPWLYKAAGVAGVGLGLSLFTMPRLFCEPIKPVTPINPPAPAPSHAPSGLPPPPQSSVSYYELSFGTVCGVCAGVFVKKGAKALAFVFGGIFVLLQYLGQQSLVRVDWGRAAKRFENLFYTIDATGAKHPPSVGSFFRWITDFLTADFQQRASFIAGFVLGLRLG